MKKFRTLPTGISLAVLFIVAAVQADYYIYTYRESGGPSMGPWFQYSGTASSFMGGNIAFTTTGTMMLDNRSYWPTAPTQITFNPPASGACGDPSPPCQSLN
ncbi:MAG TPA: hypothetical protein VE031_13155 [Chthoniobacterales bacterium]|nr:hypothetical protein [Chthoniobacterales bacterium]